MKSEIEALYRKADKAEKTKDFEAALQCYHEILRLDSQEDHAYYGAANAYAIRGLVPQVVAQYLNLVEALETKQQLEGALEVCRWVISIDPANTKARLKLIALLDKHGDKKEAIKHSFALARIYSTLGHGEQAVDLLRRLREVEPNNPELALQLGEIYIKQGQIADGLALYRSIAESFNNVQKYAKALDIRKRIKAIKINDVENLLALGRLYFKLGKLDESKAEFRQVLREDLTHFEALIQLGIIAKTQGQWEEARIPFRKAVELKPENALAQENFAEVCEALNHLEEAVAHYLNAGNLYQKSNERDKAVFVYQNVLALDSNHKTAQEELKRLQAPLIPKKRFVLTETAVMADAPPALTDLEEAGAPTAAAKQGKILLSGSVKSGPKPKSLQGHGKFNTFLKKKPGVFAASSAQSPELTRLKGSIVSHEEAVPVSPTEPPVPAVYVNPSESAAPPVDVISTGAVEAEAPERAPEEAASETFAQAPEIVETPPIITEEAPVIEAMEESSVAAPEAEAPIVEVEVPVVEAEAPVVEAEAPVVAAEPPVVEAETPMVERVELSVPEVFEVPEEKIPEVVSEIVVETPQVLAEELKPQFDLADVNLLVSQGKIGPAIRWCQEALKEFPGKRALKSRLAQIYFQFGFLEEALPLLKDVVEDSADLELSKALAETYLLLNQPEAWARIQINIAKFMIGQGDFRKAVEIVLQVLGWDSAHLEARRLLIQLLKAEDLRPFAIYHYRVLLETLEKSNDIHALIPVYQEILEALPENGSIRYKLALCYQELGQSNEAKQEFLTLYHDVALQEDNHKKAEVLERVLALDPEDEAMTAELRDIYHALGKEEESLNLALKLGDAAMKRGDLEPALHSYTAILQAQPNRKPVMARMVDLWLRQGKLDEAFRLGQSLAELYMENGEAEQAILLTKKLLESDPDNVMAHRGLASVYAKSGAETEAIAEYMTLGHLLSRNAQFDEAIQAYRHVLSLDGSFKDARYQLGVIYADHKHNWEMAAAEFKKVRNLDPRHTAALSRLVEGYAAQEDVETALNYVRDLVRLDSANSVLVEELTRETEAKVKKSPENDGLRFNLGILYRELARFDDAIRELQSVIRKLPKIALRAYAYQGLCWEEKAARENEEILYQTALKIYRKGLQLKGYTEEEYLELKYLSARLLESFGKIADALALYQEIVMVDMEYKDARDRRKQLEEEINSKKVTRLPSPRRQESKS